MKLNLQIERLLLDGLELESADLGGFELRLQQELTELLRQDASPAPRAFSAARVQAAPLSLERGTGLASLARGVARSLQSAVEQGSEATPREPGRASR
jgi:hypothetical protein